jgi:hypothetical protein
MKGVDELLRKEGVETERGHHLGTGGFVRCLAAVRVAP